MNYRRSNRAYRTKSYNKKCTLKPTDIITTLALVSTLLLNAYVISKTYLWLPKLKGNNFEQNTHKIVDDFVIYGDRVYYLHVMEETFTNKGLAEGYVESIEVDYLNVYSNQYTVKIKSFERKKIKPDESKKIKIYMEVLASNTLLKCYVQDPIKIRLRFYDNNGSLISDLEDQTIDYSNFTINWPDVPNDPEARKKMECKTGGLWIDKIDNQTGKKTTKRGLKNFSPEWFK